MESTAITGTMPSLTRAMDFSPVHDSCGTRQVSKSSASVEQCTRTETSRSIDAFQQEMRSSLRAKFKTYHAPPVHQYSSAQPATPQDVANEALSAAKSIATDAPIAQAAKSVISFRSVVQESAQLVRTSLGERDDSADLDTALAKIDSGLNELETEVANTREASTSVLAMESRTRQNTRIQIRTQEGDIVKLSLRSVDRMSAGDAAYADGEFSATSTSLEFSSNSRLRMSVEGDLNENELAAIQNVFAQAEEMAANFYGGDLAAAFGQAQGFEFDSAELAKVKMRFRASERSSVAYIQAARPAVAAPVPAAAETAPARSVTATESSNVAEQTTTLASAQLALAEAAPADEMAQATRESVATPVIAGDALSGFFQMITNFSRSVSESFALNSNGFTYKHSETFKLDLLKAVFATVAPTESSAAAEDAAKLIAAIKDVTDLSEA